MQVCRDLLSSKKFVAALVAVLAGAAVKIAAPAASVGELTAIVSPLLAYIAAQGVADVGKEKVKVEQ